MECRQDREHTTRFLRDILIPSAGPSSIPDDKVRRHVLRQETITFNIMAGESGKGAFILFPNNPGSIIGAHLKYDSTANKYVYDQAITVAQDLRKSYSLARQTGCVLTIKSSTLPSGVYALSGTFNAATYEGPPSELSDGKSIIPDYGKVLQITANSHDKIGNVKVGEGLTILALPVSWDNPYTRLSDEIASSTGMGGVYALDDTASLNYYGGPGSVTRSTPLKQASATVELFRCNFDSNQCCTSRFRLKAKVSIDDVQNSDVNITAKFSVNMLAIDGSIVKSNSLTKSFTIPSGAADSTSSDIDIDTIYPGSSDLEDPRIIGATSLSVDVGASITPGKATDLNVVVGYCEFQGKSVNGNFPGTNNPTTVVVYEGVPKGATLTGSGFKNYELIPNQELLKNITTVYPKMDPQGLAYAKAVFAHREELQLRSVWSTPEYENRMQLFTEIASRNEIGENSVAMAWGLGDIIRSIRRFVPTLAGWADQVIPGSGGVLRGVNSIANHFFGEAASGQLLAPAASGRLLTASGKLLDTSSVIPMSDAMLMRRSFAADNKLRLVGNTAALLSDNDLLIQNNLTRKGNFSLKIGAGPGTPDSCVFFPAIVVEREGEFNPGNVVGTQIYALVDGDYSKWLPTISTYKTPTSTILGVKNIGPGLQPQGIYTALPVRSIQGNEIVIDPTAPAPEGSSMQLAISVMMTGRPRGLVPLAYTGAVYPNGQVEPNRWSHLKKEGMVGYNIPLVANTAAADLRASNVEEAIKLARTHSSNPDRLHNFKIHTGARALSADEPAWVERLYELFDEVIGVNPRFAKLRDVTVWLALNDGDDNTTLDGLWDYSKADPRAGALKKVVVNSLVNSRVRGPTQEDNINAKVMALVNKIRQTGFPATPEWIRNNGNKGPSAAQIIQFKETGTLPLPEGRQPILRPVSGDVARAVAMKVFDNSFDQAKKLPAANREPLLNELIEIAAANGRITDSDTRGLRAKYFVSGVPPPTTARPRRVPLQPIQVTPPRPSSATSLESIDVQPPPPPRVPRGTRPALRFIADDDGDLA